MDINEINWAILYDEFDSRNGFERIVFGMDVYEDCELLKQISQALSLDLSFIHFPKGRAFDGRFKNEAATVNEFIDFFRRLLLRLEEQPDYFKQINYSYINMNYLVEKKFNLDLQALINFFEYHKSIGAIKAWFEFR